MSRRIDRRRFLQVSAGAAAAAVAYGVIGVPSVRSRPEPSARRVLTKEFHLGPAELAEGSRAGLASSSEGLKLGSGRHAGHVLSPVLKSDILFDYVGLFWSGLYHEDTSVAFWVRTSADGRSWSPWETVHVEMPPGPRAQYDTYGALVWADRANYVQFLAEMRGAGKKPELHRVGLTLLNPYDGPVLEAASESGDGGFASSALAAEADSDLEANATQTAAVIGKPITFKREDWGADDSLRFSAGEEIWPRSYVSTKKLIVHHTVTGNGYVSVEDAKAVVRAIYAYHASSLGWGDIGYNSLVDKFGNSYEGRRGRDGPGYGGPGGREILSEDVVGGHALIYNYGSSGIALLGTFCTPAECAGGSPTAAMVSRLEDVLTWECQEHGIDPQANSDFLLHDGSWHYNLPNIVGHRDVAGTICPGGNVYALLPTLRSDVAARLDSDSDDVVLSDGTLLTGSGGTVYVMQKGLKRHVVSLQNFIARGFSWSDVVDVSDSFLNSIPTGQPLLDALADGNLLKGSAPDVYVMEGGQKRHAVSKEVFLACGYYWDAIFTVPDSLMNSIPTGPPLGGSSCPKPTFTDGTLLKGTASTVWVMEGGQKRHAVSAEVFLSCGYQWGNVNRIADSTISAIPDGPPLSACVPNGTLLRGSAPDVFITQKGLKRHVVSANNFIARGFAWSDVEDVSDSFLNSIPTGQPLLDALADGNLLKGSAPDVYVMEGGQKRHAVSKEVFLACGYYWDAIFTVPDSLMNSIPTGPPLDGGSCPKPTFTDGTLLQGSAPDVWVMDGGQKRHAVSAEVFLSCGHQWGNVNRIADSTISAIPDGPSPLAACTP